MQVGKCVLANRNWFWRLRKWHEFCESITTWTKVKPKQMWKQITFTTQLKTATRINNARLIMYNSSNLGTSRQNDCKHGWIHIKYIIRYELGMKEKNFLYKCTLYSLTYQSVFIKHFKQQSVIYRVHLQSKKQNEVKSWYPQHTCRTYKFTDITTYM